MWKRRNNSWNLFDMHSKHVQQSENCLDQPKDQQTPWDSDGTIFCKKKTLKDLPSTNIAYHAHRHSIGELYVTFATLVTTTAAYALTSALTSVYELIPDPFETHFASWVNLAEKVAKNQHQLKRHANKCIQLGTKGFGKLHGAINTTCTTTSGGHQLRNGNQAWFSLGNCGSVVKNRNQKELLKSFVHANTGVNPNNAILQTTIIAHANKKCIEPCDHNNEHQCFKVNQNQQVILGILPALSYLIQVNQLAVLLKSQIHALKNILAYAIVLRMFVIETLLRSYAKNFPLADGESDKNAVGSDSVKVKEEDVDNKLTKAASGSRSSIIVFAQMNNAMANWELGVPIDVGGWVENEDDDLFMEGEGDEEMDEVPDFHDIIDGDGDDDDDEIRRRLRENEDANLRLVPGFPVPSYHREENALPPVLPQIDLLDDWANGPIMNPDEVPGIHDQIGDVHDYQPQNHAAADLQLIHGEDLLFNFADLAHAG